jgi:hypothetical protein
MIQQSSDEAPFARRGAADGRELRQAAGFVAPKIAGASAGPPRRNVNLNARWNVEQRHAPVFTGGSASAYRVSDACLGPQALRALAALGVPAHDRVPEERLES